MNLNLREIINEYVIDLGPATQATPTPETPASTNPHAIAGLPNFTTASTPVSPTTPTTTFSTSDAPMSAAIIEKLKGKYATSPLYPTIEQFTNSLDSLTEFIPEEGSRFRAALKQLTKSGIDAAKLTEGYQSLAVVLDAERAKFTAVITKQRVDEIGTREATLKNIADLVASKEAEIRALTDQREIIAGEIVSTKTSLDTAENSFEGAITTLRGQLEDSLRKLSIYLPASTQTATK